MTDEPTDTPEIKDSTCGLKPQPPLQETAPVHLEPRQPEPMPYLSSKTLKSRWQALQRTKKDLMSPFAFPIAFASGAYSIYQFILGAGNLSYPMLGFAAVSLIALLIPGGAPRLFALRSFAFAIDILFLSILTIAFLPFFYHAHGWPSEPIITGVVWVWLLYFVFLDWRFHCTPGKRMLGLEIISGGTGYSLPTSFLRAFLTLFLPLVVGSWLGERLMNDSSKARFAFGLGVQAIFWLANPISILILGGNRGFADRATNTEVRLACGKRRRSDPDVGSRNWGTACILPFIGGSIIACAGYVFSASVLRPNSPIHIPEKPSGEKVSTVLTWGNPNADGTLPACLASGFRDVSKVIRSIHIDTLSDNPFTVENTDLFVNPIDAANLRQTSGLLMIRITTAPWVSPAAYRALTLNLARCYGMASATGNRSTAVVQFEQLNDYGLFVIIRKQYTILGVQRDASFLHSEMADLRPDVLVGVVFAPALARYALLGDGATREQFLKEVTSP